MGTLTVPRARRETVQIQGKNVPIHDVYPTSEGHVIRFSRKKDQTIAKPALVGWAARVEREKILSLLDADTGQALLTQLREANGVYKTTGEPKLTHEILRDTAGDAGSACHARIEWYLSRLIGRDSGDAPEVDAASAIAWRSMEQWFQSVTLKPLYIEHAVHLLPSELSPDGMGGRLDLFAEVDGIEGVTGPCLLDWKTSTGIWWDFGLQVAFYGYALHKREGVPWPVPGVIVRPPKTEMEFAKRGGWPEVKVIPPARMEQLWIGVRAMQVLYTLMQEGV